jgi:hypothetical protein
VYSYQQINCFHLVKYNFCWNYSTSAGGMYFWNDRVVFLCTESGKYNHIAIYFIFLMCNTEVYSFVCNGMYKFSSMKII